jgi:hypothetical protein
MEFRDRPSPSGGPLHPIQVVGSGGRGFIVTVQAVDVSLDLKTTASNTTIKKALRKAIEPVTGDAVVVDYWETRQDAQGNWTWKVWARR